jgi:ubiquinone/menaquinone biosynthesis C-methylase UbiE
MNYEKSPTEKIVPDMGDNTSRVFAGETQSNANIEMYQQTAEFFADEIKKRLPVRDASYTMIDVGSFQGELLANIIEKLSEYHFETTAIDINQQALRKNFSSDSRVVAHAEALPFDNQSVDIAIVRYVLQWNSAEKQKQILMELARTVKEFALVEHLGSDVIDAEEWRGRMSKLFDGSEIAKLKRVDYFLSSRDEIEEWMQQNGIKFERLKDRVIENVADAFIERFSLNSDEAEKTKQILGDKNYIRQTDWIVFPNNKI